MTQINGLADVRMARTRATG